VPVSIYNGGPVPASYGGLPRTVKFLINPGDPSFPSSGIDSYGAAYGCYCVNVIAFPVNFDESGKTGNFSSLQGSFPDGTTNTIGFTEHYATCGKPQAIYNGGYEVDMEWSYGPPWTTYYAPYYGYFTTGPASIFQVRPTFTGSNPTCDPTRPSTPWAGGIQTAMVDGSVRSVSGSVSPNTWWIATVPNDGLVLPSDW
jgi:hypothetical protein